MYAPRDVAIMEGVPREVLMLIEPLYTRSGSADTAEPDVQRAVGKDRMASKPWRVIRFEAISGA